jgi:hypothetical protein
MNKKITISLALSVAISVTLIKIDTINLNMPITFGGSSEPAIPLPIEDNQSNTSHALTQVKVTFVNNPELVIDVDEKWFLDFKTAFELEDKMHHKLENTKSICVRSENEKTLLVATDTNKLDDLYEVTSKEGSIKFPSIDREFDLNKISCMDFNGEL